MRKLLKLVLGSFLISQLAAPTGYLYASSGQVNWGTPTGGSYYTPSSPGAPGQVLVNTGAYSVDWSSGMSVLPIGGQGFVGPIFFSTGCTVTATTALSTPSALTSFPYSAYALGTTGGPSLPAGFFQAGKAIRYTLRGTLSTPGSPGSGSVNFSVKLGTSTIGTTGVIQTPVALSSMTFSMEGILSCVSSGTFVNNAGLATTSFSVRVASGTTQTTGPGNWEIGNSTNISSGFNVFVANDFNVTVQFSISSAGYVLILNEILYEDLN